MVLDGIGRGFFALIGREGDVELVVGGGGSGLATGSAIGFSVSEVDATADGGRFRRSRKGEHDGGASCDLGGEGGSRGRSWGPLLPRRLPPFLAPTSSKCSGLALPGGLGAALSTDTIEEVLRACGDRARDPARPRLAALGGAGNGFAKIVGGMTTPCPLASFTGC